MRLTVALAGLLGALSCSAQPNQSGIAHVAFRVADLEASRAFYYKLGFEQFYEARQGERTTQAFLKVNDTQIIELYPRTEAAEPLGLMHVCYEASNIDALHAELVERGLPISAVRTAGAGNRLMTMKDPEGQTIEYTQYMPGSRHWEDRGKHLGANRVASLMLGATTWARDVEAMRRYYVEKLGFTLIAAGLPVRLRMPGDSGQEVDLVAAGEGVRTGIEFGVPDLKRAGEVLAALGFKVTASPARLTVADPDGAVISFVKSAR